MQQLETSIFEEVYKLLNYVQLSFLM